MPRPGLARSKRSGDRGRWMDGWMDGWTDGRMDYRPVEAKGMKAQGWSGLELRNVSFSPKKV